MPTYIIGDTQGCFEELSNLLDLINFDENKDQLGFVGDLVNRGPDSLKLLRFIRNLKDPLVVLGNHDMYLLILGHGLVASDAYQHTLHELIEAPDRLELLDWLRNQPLVLKNETLKFVIVHAGLPPQWSIEESMAHSQEVQHILCSDHFQPFLLDLFGNEPTHWDNGLTGQDRLRYTINAFTRMRFCRANGDLEFKPIGDKSLVNESYRPWFSWRQQDADQYNICFGHWAALGGQCDAPGIFALDTGCAWGNSLTALRIEDKKRFSVPAKNYPPQ